MPVCQASGEGPLRLAAGHGRHGLFEPCAAFDAVGRHRLAAPKKNLDTRACRLGDKRDSPVFMRVFQDDCRLRSCHTALVIPTSLPNLDALDVEALKALAMAQHAELRKQQQSNAEQIEHLTLVIEKYRRMIFGSKSEKLTGQLDQLEFQLEELETTHAATEAAEQPPASRKTTPSRPRAPRKPLPEDLPREVVTHMPCYSNCPCCGGALRQFGQDVSEQLERTPATYKVIQHVRPKFACASCDGVV